MKLVKRFLLSILSLALAFLVFSFVFSPLPGYIPVLMYHYLYPKSQMGPGTSSLNVSVENFDRQMWFLKTFGYRVLSLDEYYDIKMGLRKPRGKEVLITFDDGHHTYVDYALPILERYQLRSVNFLIWQHLIGDSKAYIGLEEAKKLSENPLVDFQSHTLTHPNLKEVSLSQAEDEIVQSKKYLETALNREIKYFCYPEGSFDSDLMALVKAAGYQMAFRTSFKRFKSYPQIPYAIVRIKINPKYNLFVFWWFVSGLDDYFKKVDRFFHQLTLTFHNGKLAPYKSGYRTT